LYLTNTFRVGINILQQRPLQRRRGITVTRINDIAVASVAWLVMKASHVREGRRWGQRKPNQCKVTATIPDQGLVKVCTLPWLNFTWVLGLQQCEIVPNWLSNVQ
jgi:hypothetical protein